jgi:hypothetical protein
MTDEMPAFMYQKMVQRTLRRLLSEHQRFPGYTGDHQPGRAEWQVVVTRAPSSFTHNNITQQLTLMRAVNHCGVPTKGQLMSKLFVDLLDINCPFTAISQLTPTPALRDITTYDYALISLMGSGSL